MTVYYVTVHTLLKRHDEKTSLLINLQNCLFDLRCFSGEKVVLQAAIQWGALDYSFLFAAMDAAAFWKSSPSRDKVFFLSALPFAKLRTCWRIDGSLLYFGNSLCALPCAWFVSKLFPPYYWWQGYLDVWWSKGSHLYRRQDVSEYWTPLCGMKKPFCRIPHTPFLWSDHILFLFYPLR